MFAYRTNVCHKNYHIFSLLIFSILIIMAVFENVVLQTFVVNDVVVILDNDPNRTLIFQSHDNNTVDVFEVPSNLCSNDQVTYYLYTQRNHQQGHQICINDTYTNLNDTFFNPHEPVKIIIHGYNSDMYLDALIDIKNEYLNKSNYNIIAVDWHKLALPPYYPNAVNHVPYVGECLAKLIERLINSTKIKDIHIIGFSLGAHVPAYMANILKPYKVSRITGLDPAMPFFITVDNDKKLDSSDAEFVDVLHTNAFVQGQFQRSGHIDFYMNGGINQPGCWKERNPFECNHHRALNYFVESINTKMGFWGWPCSGILAYLLDLCPPRFPAVLAGDCVDKHYRGFYLVKTKAEKPFADGLMPFKNGEV